ncbi:MAG TPA: UvrD-helicase domain-containing protein, partial [Pseudomonadota bacterium]|nr:UvrD-helicase domain-containing protein [Pseudomonadota bacterium]
MFGSTAAAAFDRSPGDAGAGDAEFLGLSDEQRAVVLARPGPLLGLAGAGSGKTRALTQRVARFLRAGVAPERVLLMTFTQAAAAEMMQR